MKAFLTLAIVLAVLTANPADAQSFIYSYREPGKDAASWRVCVGRIENGQLTTTELFSTGEVRLFYSFVASAGNHAVLVRSGEGIAEDIDVRTGKRFVIDSHFLQAVSVSEKEFIYLAMDFDAHAGKRKTLKKYVLGSGTSRRLCPHSVIQKIPFPAVEDLQVPVEFFWGIFEIDGRQVVGKVELQTGAFSELVNLPGSGRVLSADVADDGSLVLLGLEDDAPTVPSEAIRTMTAKLVLIETAGGITKTAARSIYQAVPASSGLPPRFCAVFAGPDHILYPETILDGAGGISYQRLVGLDIASGKSSTVAVIRGGDRLVNAIPVRAADGIVEWGEYQIDPETRAAAPIDRFRGRPYRIGENGELTTAGVTVGYPDRPAYVWNRGGVLVFIGRLQKEGSPGLYVWADGMEQPVRVNPDSSAVQTFGFLDTR